MNTELTSLTDIARQTIRKEAEALLALAEQLDDTSDFARLVEALAVSGGRLVVCGIGKSAIIAQKIVATLNSTGTPALFMHAADAIHGDLGMIQPDDWVLCLSKSGETPEIRALAPLIKQLGNPLAAMTANRNSTLARFADLVLWTPVEEEADPNNLAPTVSTAAQMALGDALAVALLSERGFSTKDFARLHPGGALGKQLYLRAGDLSILHERPQVRPDTPLHEVIIEISSKRLGATAVVDADGNLTGIITDGDLRRMLQRTGDIQHVTAQEICSPQPKTIEASALAVEALSEMRRHSVSQLIVIDNGQYAGIVHLHDLLREGLV
jgi:arabinose-5-phosphate isomerase